MQISGNTLFAFVDLKDPFMPTEVAEEEQPGPVLSMLGVRRFDFLFLFCTPHTSANAWATREEVGRRHPHCHVMVHEIPASDPKDYSALMGNLGREVRRIMRLSRDATHHVCVSSGTAEMRAAWFLLTAVGVLPATLLQVGSPAEPLFGPANVKEVRLGMEHWAELRDLVMPVEYFAGAEARARRPLGKPRSRGAWPAERAEQVSYSAPCSPGAAAYPELEEALQELGIFIGSAVLREAAERAAVAAGCDLPILLTGETGTGKELFARLIHRLSARRRGPLVAVNCAAIPRELVESTLFGHVRGAFTGATHDQKGKFEQAGGGTLMLDEVGELPLEAQAKLLRALQEGVIEPVGSGRERKVDVRIIAATNRNLRKEVAQGRFRADLYFRLEVVTIRLPPLRERPGEIPRLALGLLKQINQRRRHPRQLSREALRRLEQHTWPGNVRELANVLERSVLYARGDVLGPEDLLISDTASPADRWSFLPEPEQGFSLEEFLSHTRKRLFERALAKSQGNQTAAAALLGVSKQAVSKFLAGEADNLG